MQDGSMKAMVAPLPSKAHIQLEKVIWNNYLKSLGIVLRAYNEKIFVCKNLLNLSNNSVSLLHVSHNQISSLSSAQYNGSSTPCGCGQEDEAPSSRDPSPGLQFHPRMRKLSEKFFPSLASFHRSSDPCRHAPRELGLHSPTESSLIGPRIWGFDHPASDDF